MRKLDNKGLSLIELLIAVSILGIIVVPLLNSFVSSHKLNAKSKQTLRATTLAQNEMEIFEKEKLADICDPDKFAYSATRTDGYQILDQPNPADAGDDGCYSFVRKGIINDDSGREMFDVYITLNPERAGAAGRYYDENTTPMLTMNTVSNLDSGTYVQSIRTENNAVDQDTVAYSYFQANQNPAFTWTVNQFKQTLRRQITIDITQADESGVTYTKATVSYEYQCDNIWVMPADKRVYSLTPTVIYDNSQSLDESGTPIELKSIYLFFAPRYGADYADSIVINNENGLPIDIYIIRQELLVEGGNTVQVVPTAYSSTLTIRDVVTGGKTGATYHTNLNIDQPVMDGNGQLVNVVLEDAGMAVSPAYNRAQAIAATGLKALDAAEEKDRIYTMTVKVYKAGDNPATATPYASLQGTKLE